MTPVEGFDKRRAFCARLKSERERRGTSLAEIADVTKVKASLLDALERGDLSRWPKGIYRRAFFRDYVAAIGLPADALVGEFLDVFGERDPAAPPAAGVNPTPARVTCAATEPRPPAAEPPHSSFRITFAGSGRTAGLSSHPNGSGEAASVRIRAALVDIAAVSLLAWLLVSIIPLTFPLAAMVIALPYHLLAAALGGSPAERLARLTQARLGARVAKPLPTRGSIPYGSPLHKPVQHTWLERLGDAFRGLALLRPLLDRTAEIRQVTFDRQRQRDLASMRRRLAEAANRTSADEIPA